MSINLTLHQGQGGYLIKEYRPDAIRVNDEWHSGAVVIRSDAAVMPFRDATPSELSADDAQSLTADGPDVFLFTVDDGHHFPAAEFIKTLAARNLGCDTMNFGAACRTFNVLVSEGRKVVLLRLVTSD